ncbi:MAG TPA: hypothetical protein VN700_13400 [Vicinamibacterales bacterium]|nr:hypothetical protein [Vicinamibacterales bacterium]
MRSRRSIIVIEDFYADADAVRNYALRQRFYTPYEDEDAVRAGRVRATWWASAFRPFEDCPFKSSTSLVAALEAATGEAIDAAHWRARFPVDASSKPRPSPADGLTSCLWNCCFHVKPDNKQQLGDGVHNHVTDGWNSVGPDGWAGIVYLDPTAPIEGGLHLWRNLDKRKTFDWMTDAENWELVDAFGNLFNRLLLVRGDVPHSGAGGWGDRLENGRMYQTFFFRTIVTPTPWPVSI